MYIHGLIIVVLIAFFRPLLFITLFIFPIVFLNAQNYELNVRTKDSSNLSILKTIPYHKKHLNKKSIYNEIDSISKKLVSYGFINNIYTVNKKDSIFNCTYTLNLKIDSIRIFYNSNSIDKKIIDKIATHYTESHFEIAINNLETSLNSIINYYEEKGHSFAKVSLSNLNQQGKLLSARLNFNISKKRKINSIVIKGYDKFPKKYLNHYLKLKKNSVFNLSTLNNVYNLINTIPFVSQIKKPEILFTKDSTTIFLYLKKKSSSNFDGIISFSSEKNNNKLKFSGYLDLYLNNIFDKGESFSLKWENNRGNNQTLDLNLTSPYIFNSKFSIEGNFSIFKQDSTYINTRSQLKINFSINHNNSINTIVDNENSNLTSSINTTSELQQFKKQLIGFSYAYKVPSDLQFLNPYKFLVDIGYLTGNRIIENKKTIQNKIQFSIESVFDLNYKNSIFIKNISELLNTSNLLQNELFRIGGINSIRGFDEQSILTSKYSTTNIEYRYRTNTNEYVYSITDFALLKNSSTNSTTKLLGVGVGYYFNTKNSIVNISYVIGKNDKSSLNLANSKVHIKITYKL